MSKIKEVPSPWVLLITGIFGLSLVVCACMSGWAFSHQGTLSGAVVLGPTCPVEQETTPPTCAYPPGQLEYQPAGHQQLAIEMPFHLVITTVTTDRDGHFTVTLPAGSYLITAHLGRGRLQSTLVRVITGQTTTVQITLDTGIR